MQCVTEVVTKLENVGKIRAFWGVADKGQGLGFGIAYKLLITVRIRLIFDFAILGAVGKQFDVTGLLENKDVLAHTADVISPVVLGDNVPVIAMQLWTTK